MTCALCKNREADKKNTHFLTDGIIRSCLNLDGSKEREKGFYFDLSNDNAFIEFNFQRGTSVDKLKSSLGRDVTDEEIEKAKSIPFSVDNVFCSVCESYFTEIETKFISEILPSFRNADLTGKDRINLTDIKTVRLFFYIQVWRTAVCDDTLKISADVAENLRLIILNHSTVNANELSHYPIAITYLQTTGDEAEYTTNYVGFTNDRNPNLIIMNDFVIQFYENPDTVKFFNFYGLTTEQNYKELINFSEQQFVVNIFQNSNRKQLLKDFITTDRVKLTIQYYVDSFEELWLKLFGVYPPVQTTQEYLKALTGGDEFNVLKYTKENIMEITVKFIQIKIN
ncbi:hypothetical protein EWU23_13340 [Cytophagaceae bacterium 50C-KIRBA]|uniref:Uncharacterized protein n=1 Tax=Aquirufa beregesia TaxID=2516556 RepID=A0ABX0EZH1_9BACT|nr:hypothetical protein [Aquirufa beregesia]NGZ45463.1 hypothetical protein [Aquirufa beregesia]